MHNVIILGTGRSGTSMTAALLRNVEGLFFGYELLPPNRSNVLGYYECYVVNAVNNFLIKKICGTGILDSLPRYAGACARRFLPAAHCETDALWLAAPRRLRTVRIPGDLEDLMRSATSRRPFCLKDPRFSVTLPLWRPFLPADTRFVAVYRDPERTVASMLRDARECYDPPLELSPRFALLCWYRSYRRILYEFSGFAPSFFVHFDQLLSGEALAPLAGFLGASLDAGQLDFRLSRSTSQPLAKSRLYAKARELYRALQARNRADLESLRPLQASSRERSLSGGSPA